MELLKNWGIERLVLCGMMTHLDIHATARAARDLGFQVLIAEDACATRDLTSGNTVISADVVQKSFMDTFSSFSKVMKSEEILALLAAEMVK
jgi:nicotinamidase-related amidase